jgi:prolyl 4-hydroxylase
MSLRTDYIADAAFTVADLLSANECTEAIDFAERKGFEEAPITTAMGFVHNKDYRNNRRVMTDHPEFANTLWERLRPHIPSELGPWTAIGLNERLRIYRYDHGNFFRPHSDGAFRRNASERSLFTVIIYLNDGYKGGKTAFEDFAVTPVTGSALCFLHPLRHEGCTVEKGTKYALRTDAMFRTSPT